MCSSAASSATTQRSSQRLLWRFSQAIDSALYGHARSLVCPAKPKLYKLFLYTHPCLQRLLYLRSSKKTADERSAATKTTNIGHDRRAVHTFRHVSVCAGFFICISGQSGEYHRHGR